MSECAVRLKKIVLFSLLGPEGAFSLADLTWVAAGRPAFRDRRRFRLVSTHFSFAAIRGSGGDAFLRPEKIQHISQSTH